MLSFVTLSGGWEVNVESSWSQAMTGEAGSAPAARGRWNWLLRIGGFRDGAGAVCEVGSLTGGACGLLHNEFPA